MRKAHILKENKSTQYPVRMVFFDTETLKEEISDGVYRHKLRLGWACYWRRREKGERDTEQWYRITNKDEFWEWVFSLSKGKTRLYLVAHNIDFDLGVLGGYEKILEEGYKLTKNWERGMSRFFCWRKGNRTIIGMDNANIFPGKLENLGKSLGLPKLDIDFEDATDDELSIYCRRDVEIMLAAWKRWINFCRQEDLGSFAPTLAAQAFNAFRHRFMPTEIFIHNHEDVLKLERECYKGGRCECFFIGRPPGKNYYYLDVNSMYPHVMLRNKYPVKLKFYRKNPSVNYLRKCLENYAVCAKVRVSIDVPAVPLRHKQKTFYPVGEFDCYLSTPEIQYIMENGKVIRVYEMAVYEQADIFSDYVRYFYGKRMEAKESGDSAQQYFFKILLNSLYGKFGQKSIRWERIGDCEPDREGYETIIDNETGKKYTIRYHNGIVEQSQDAEESYNSFPAVAAHVTAYARIYLFNLMRQAGLENVYYTDTDSLIVNDTGYQRLKHMIDSKELGKLKLEEENSILEIRGPKDYTFGSKTKIKGIRIDAVKIGEGVYEQEKWCGFATRIRKGLLNTYIVEKQKKTLRREYTKGRVREGGRVIPWVLPDDWEILSVIL